MWRLTFITALIYIFGVATRPMEPLEGLLWPHRIANTISSEDLRSIQPADIFKQQNFPRNVNIEDPDYDVILLRPPNEKRVLAMFSRWRPINKFGKERTSIRNNLIPEESITTQTRSRMLGQPLRWG